MKSLIITLFVILTLMVGCEYKSETPNSAQNNANSSDSVSFYDFSFLIEVVNERYGVVEIIYYNEFLTKNKDSCFIQHHIFADESTNEQYKVPKRQTITVSAAKMDSVYHIIANTVTPKYLRNKSIQKVPPIKSIDDEWKICKIKLDLKLRGNIYETEDPNYQHLIRYILKN